MATESRFQETVLMNFGPERRFGYVLDWDVSETLVSAKAYQVDGVGAENQLYFGDSDKLEDAAIFLQQSVKWDGCIDTHFPSSDFHFCNGEDLLQLGELLKYIYNKALQLMGEETIDEYVEELDETLRTFDPPALYSPKRSIS